MANSKKPSRRKGKKGEFEVVQTVHRRRGPFGWLITVLFYAFHAIMAIVFLISAMLAGEASGELNNLVALVGEIAPAVAGSDIVEVIMVLVVLLIVATPLAIWACGTLVLGGLLYFAQGRQEVRALSNREKADASVDSV